MTIETTVIQSPLYTGDGATVAFATGFKFTSVAHVYVYLYTGGVKALVSTASYTLTGLRNPTGGTVTFNTAPTAVQTVQIERLIALTQTTDLRGQSYFSPESVEDEFDLIVMMGQQAAAASALSLKLPNNSTANPLLPTPSALAPLGWNATATGLANLTLGTASTADSYAAGVTGISALRSAAGRLGRGLTPYDFGGKADGVTDDSAAVQALVDYVKNGYRLSVVGNDAHVDLGGQTWLCATSINCTNIRPNPGSGARSSAPFTIKNGHLHGTCAGKTVLDCASTSSLHLRDLEITGDEVNQPQCGIYYGLGVTPGTGAISGSSAQLTNVNVYGFFSKSGIVAYSAEVSNHTNVRITNQSRSLTAFAMTAVSCTDTLNTYFGSFTSDYITLPAAAVPHSNICHNWSQSVFLRSSDLQYTILGITKANPAVVSLGAASLALALLTNGDKVYFTDPVGMTQLRDTIGTVANINLAAGTFELSGVNSTAYGTFTSGILWNQTGPALLLNGSGMVYSRAGYILTYGAPSVVIDMKAGDTMKHVDLEFQQEAHTSNVVRFDMPVTDTIIDDFRITLLGQNQRCSDCYVWFNSLGGLITIHNLEVNVVDMVTVPGNLMFKNANLLVTTNAVIRTPIFAAFNAPLTFGVFKGVVYAPNQEPYAFHYGSRSFDRMEFTGYTVAGLPPMSAGAWSYATNGRKNGEGAGVGTGVMVFRDNTAWRACDTGATVAA